MITFAGVQLVAPLPANLERLEAALDPRTLHDWERSLWPGNGRVSVTYPYGAHSAERPLRVNEVFWPVGASRWAVGRFLADDAMLASIRQAVYAGSAGYQSGTLVMDEGLEGRVGAGCRAAMYLLTPRPIFQAGEPSGLWLLTLVDDRWFWAQRSGVVAITEGSTTWAALYAQIATLLGVTISVDTIAGAYGTPPSALAAQYESLPGFLDTVAHAVGQRIVRRPDGSVLAIGATSASAVAEANLQAASPFWAGGLFDLHP